MSARTFIDSNVLIYGHDVDAREEACDGEEHPSRIPLWLSEQGFSVHRFFKSST